MAYWQDRVAEAQAKRSQKRIKQIEGQMAKYYAKTMRQVIRDFEDTYAKLLATVEAGREPVPADLYKLDKYWQMQAQCKAELDKLGAKQIALLSDAFEKSWFDIYNTVKVDGATAYSTMDTQAVQQLINQIWCADGKNWSSRIWQNTAELLDTLNEELIHTIAAGRRTRDLKNILQERFNVSYNRADSLVRTEIAHIQTQAARQRYMDYGIEMVQIWADKDERQCEHCGKLHKTIYPIGAHVPIPAHPKCRCCIVPVVETELQAPQKAILMQHY